MKENTKFYNFICMIQIFSKSFKEISLQTDKILLKLYRTIHKTHLIPDIIYIIVPIYTKYKNLFWC